ncbi:MAG: hypothetical protein PHI97_34760, partial [Desulfobulbus sp.]|nr:hypothetical protein [Desulfobulbus sp.]
LRVAGTGDNITAPQAGSKSICSKCGEKRPRCDTLRVRTFAFVPLWGYRVFSSTLQGGCSAQLVASMSKSCHGLQEKAILFRFAFKMTPFIHRSARKPWVERFS